MQDIATVLYGHVVQIMAVELQEVKGDQVEVMLPAVDRLAQLLRSRTSPLRSAR
jgi:hypothetical protein